MHGVINFLKPPGMTSHDAVAFVRRIAGTKRVGHTGTLDPAAAGVLPICIGQATRLVEYLQEGTKEYIAEVTFGHETDTLDAMGEIVSVGHASGVTLESLRATLEPFRGIIKQTPPLYSAIKQGGKKLYELARAGTLESEVEIASREVTISQLHLTRFVPGDTSTQQPCAMLHIKCSGGTYIRSLVRDIGRSLNCGATMTFLVRTRNGVFKFDRSHTVEEIGRDCRAAILPIMDALALCAATTVTDNVVVQHLSQGRQIEAPKASASGKQVLHERVLFVDEQHTVAAFAIPAELGDSAYYKPEKVFFLDGDD
ncbi:MAG TPA: tRNA pseudouridine(55) synthase TruB [Abditibacteriaceae bacterium]|jgi:tRNA pseudouridine55 synthase